MKGKPAPNLARCGQQQTPAQQRKLRRRHDHEPEWQPADPPAYPRLETITAPTLVIVGDRDVPDILHAVDVLAARIPNAKKVVMRNTAHLPSMELPDEFNQILGDFLNSLS